MTTFESGGVAERTGRKASKQTSLHCVLLVCRNLGSFALRVNLTTNSGELNSRKETGVAPQFFFRRSYIRQCEADGATADEINA